MCGHRRKPQASCLLASQWQKIHNSWICKCSFVTCKSTFFKIPSLIHLTNLNWLKLIFMLSLWSNLCLICFYFKNENKENYLISKLQGLKCLMNYPKLLKTLNLNWLLNVLTPSKTIKDYFMFNWVYVVDVWRSKFQFVKRSFLFVQQIIAKQ